MDDRDYCAARVRDLDSDRYVTALFAPDSRRADLLALYAFNLELGLSRETVTESALGRMRLQWWREAVGDCYAGNTRQHHVLQALAGAIERHGLPQHLFDRILEGREMDFDVSRPDSLEQMVAYAESTSGALNMLAVRILGVREQRLEQAALRVGAAWTLAGTLRGLRHLLLTGRQPLPRDRMKDHGLGDAALRSLRRSDALCSLTADIAGLATNILDQHRVAGARRAAPVLLQAVLARAYLKRLAETGHNPFDERNLHPLRHRAWRLMVPAITGRI